MGYKALVNETQSPDERRFKYNYLRSIGQSREQAIIHRDWRWSKLVRHDWIDRDVALEIARSYNPHITIPKHLDPNNDESEA